MGTGGSPSSGHQAPPQGQGRAEAEPEHGPVGGLGSLGSMAGQDRALGSYRLVLLYCWGRG